MNRGAWQSGFFYFCKKKKVHWNYDRDCSESKNGFDSIDILTILIVSIHEQGIPFYLLCLLQFP